MARDVKYIIHSCIVCEDWMYNTWVFSFVLISALSSSPCRVIRRCEWYEYIIFIGSTYAHTHSQRLHFGFCSAEDNFRAPDIVRCLNVLFLVYLKHKNIIELQIANVPFPLTRTLTHTPLLEWIGLGMSVSYSSQFYGTHMRLDAWNRLVNQNLVVVFLLLFIYNATIGFEAFKCNRHGWSYGISR